jgi:hypothetical protein
VARFFYFAFDKEFKMVSFPVNDGPRSKARITINRAEARDMVAAVTISVMKVQPPDEVGYRLERLLNRVLDALGMTFDICPECGDVTIDGEVVCVRDTEDDHDCDVN